MKVTFFYKNLAKEEELQFREYFSPKLESIRNLLKTSSLKQSSLLKINVEKFDKHNAYQVELHLTLPLKSLIATEDSHDITKAIDFSKDRLTEQIKKYKSQLRGERGHNAVRNKQPLLETELVFE